MPRGVNRVEIKGARELGLTTQEAANTLNNLTLPHAKAARIAALRAKREAPVLSGALRRSIKSGVSGSRGYIQAGGGEVGKYVFAVHSGHGTYKPNPFLTRAIRASEKQWIQPYEETIKTALEKVHGI